MTETTMSWEAITALAAVLTVLIVIAQQIGALNRNHVARAEKETEERIAMDHRVTALEKGLTQMGVQLTDHIRNTGKAIDALRQEMPTAIMNGVSRAIASTLETQQRVHRELIEEIRAEQAAASSPAPKRTPRTNRSKA
jgi:uncharacterized protein YlxW (UPF0749 family)